MGNPYKMPVDSRPPAKKMKFSPGGLKNGVPGFQKLQEERKNLPIFSAKRKLIQELNRLDTAIVIGETGSGKTTQLPQYIFEDRLHKNLMIAITQPRRVAAITVAQRVAQERGSEPGQVVGHCVRFDDMTSEKTRIKYMTDGMLLREAILDPLLKRYSFVILDEAHERTIHTDVLFGVVKQAQKRRRLRNLLPLKIIIMSATMDVDHFSKFFNKAPVLYLEGRQFPVQVYYSRQPQSDYVFAAVVALFQIHREEPADQHVLIFLTGQEEIDSVVRTIHEIAKGMVGDVPPLAVSPLYAALPSHLQLRAFNPAPKGTRKVIVATNIAETSITIHGINFVIDTGVVKAKIFTPRSGLDLLKVVKLSKAQALQRSGRAGREAAGTCYRLYTEEEFHNFPDNTVPEIQRCNLSSVALQLLAMGISDIVNFDFMDKPSTEFLIGALHQLHTLGAVVKEDTIKLTAIGKKMAAFPLDPKLSKTLLIALELQCLEEILTIVSMLSVDSVLFTPQSKREEALAVRQKFVSSDGDHITLLNIFKAFRGVKGNKEWCRENFINGRNMSKAMDIRKQLRQICDSQAMTVKSCGLDTSIIRRCLAAGLFMNAAELQKEGDVYISLTTREPVHIHPSSALFRCKPACVVYNELVKTSKCYMRDLSVVDPDWLYEAAPAYFKRKKPSK